MTELASTQALPAHALGSWLSRQRQARGLARDDVARMTRLPCATIAALESGDARRVPRGYAHGYLRSYAGAIGLDGDHVVRCWRQASDAEEAAPPAPAPTRWLPPPRVLVAAVVGLALLVMTLLVLRGPGGRAPLQLRKASTSAQRAPYVAEPPPRR